MFNQFATPLPKQVSETLDLPLNATLTDLSLAFFCVDLQATGRSVVRSFQHQTQLPGVVLLQNQRFWGMISRNRFWEYMSRPYSLELFLDRPICSLYEFMQTPVLCLPATTTIMTAAQASLGRSAELLNEPLVVDHGNHQYALLDTHQLLVIASQLHQLTAQLLHESSHQLKIANAKLTQLATADGLTKIANRRRFDDYLVESIAHCAQAQQPLTILLADVDFFKLYNDHWGHIEGDCCLQAIARCLNETIAPYPGALVARYGGEEFAIILPNHQQAETTSTLEQLRTALHELNLKHPDSPISDRITLSIGAITFIAQAGTEPKQLLQNADRALYAAKQAGRDRYVIREWSRAELNCCPD